MGEFLEAGLRGVQLFPPPGGGRVRERVIEGR